MTSITLDQAQQVLNRALELARLRKVNVAVAVVDDHADPVIIVRTDGTRPHLPDIARGKAMAAAIWGQASSSLVERGMISSVRQAVNNMHGGRLVFAPGAIPLVRDGVALGAIGVGGSGPSSDEEIAAEAASVINQA